MIQGTELQAEFAFEDEQESRRERCLRLLAAIPQISTADRLDVTFSEANAIDAERLASVRLLADELTEKPGPSHGPSESEGIVPSTFGNAGVVDKRPGLPKLPGVLTRSPRFAVHSDLKG